jgi:hypothetical protein
MIRRPRLDPYLLLLFALCLPSLAPLAAPGYFYDSHDGRHSVFYLVQFDASLRDGAWWPRWAMHHIQGLGYPTFLIQAPLGFYLGELFVLLGAGFTVAAKLTWAVGVLAGAWGMYALVQHWVAATSRTQHTGYASAYSPAHMRLAAVAAGVLYTYFPYHIADIYVRGALNDSLLLGWLPWLFLAFDRLLLRGTAEGWQRRLGAAMLVLAGTLLTHTFALLSIIPLLISFVLFRLVEGWHSTGLPWRRALLALAGGAGGLLLCAIFVLPLLAEGQYLQQQVYVTGTYDFRNHFVQIGQYFSPFWGFGYSNDPAGANDGMSFQLGVLLVLLAITALFNLRYWRAGRAVQAYLLVTGTALLLVMTPLAQPLWETLPALTVIQFPWRLLALAGFVFSALGGLVLFGLAAPLTLPPLRGPGHESRVASGNAAEAGHASPPNARQPLAGVRSHSTSPSGGLLLFALLGVFASWPYLQANLSPVEDWREDGRAVFRFEQEHPDMIAYTQWVAQPFTTTLMSAGYAAPDYVEDHGYTTSLQRLQIVEGEGTVLTSHSRGSSGGGVVQMATPGVVQVNFFYFPGWRVHIDGLPAATRPAPTGAILVEVGAGRHTIDAHFGDTPPRTTGAFVSGAMLLLTFALLLWPQQNRGAVFSSGER